MTVALTDGTTIVMSVHWFVTLYCCVVYDRFVFFLSHCVLWLQHSTSKVLVYLMQIFSPWDLSAIIVILIF